MGKTKIVQVTSYGGNREDYTPWYSKFYLVTGTDKHKFNEAIFFKMKQHVARDTGFDHEDDALNAIRAAGYTVQEMDEPLYIHADDWA